MKREQALSVLAEHHDSQRIPSLIVLLRELDSDWGLRIRAAKELGESQSQEAVPALIDALRGNDEWVASAAANALGKIKDIRAVPALIEVLRSEEAVRLITEAKKRNDLKDVLAALQFISDITELRALAAEALGQIASDEALEALAEALYDDDATWSGVQSTVVRVLGQVDKTKARNFLAEWRQKPGIEYRPDKK